MSTGFNLKEILISYLEDLGVYGRKTFKIHFTEMGYDSVDRIYAGWNWA